MNGDRNLAVFCDFENIALGARDAKYASFDMGLGLEEAFRHGVAGGSAALLSGGTGLCKAEDVRRLSPQVHLQQL